MTLPQRYEITCGRRHVRQYNDRAAFAHAPPKEELSWGGRIFVDCCNSTRIPLSLTNSRRASTKGFEKNVQDGLTSDTFNVSSNIAAHDTREGLADADVIARIMVCLQQWRKLHVYPQMHAVCWGRLQKEQYCTFDEARVRLVKKRMVAAGVDPDTGLPLDNKTLSFDVCPVFACRVGPPLRFAVYALQAPRNKVTIYKNRNMVHRLIGDINGDGYVLAGWKGGGWEMTSRGDESSRYVGKAPDLQSAVDMAVEVPDGAYFTWHIPTLHNDYASRLYVWSEKRAKIMV